MALNEQLLNDLAWLTPIWPDRLPDPETMKIAYGTFEDELVVRFYPNRRSGTVVVPITTPDEDYAGVLADITSGEVVGIHVYPLRAFAVQLHPAWKPLAEDDPAAEFVAQIVTDIKDLFDRYGVEDPEGN